MTKKYILHTIRPDGVCSIEYLASFTQEPQGCEYRLINRQTERSYATPGFAAAWKAKTLPEVAKS